MNILFVVCGEGLGHASRCLHLGHYLTQQGHVVHFAGYGKSYDFMEQHGCMNLHHASREVCLEGEDGFFSLKKTLLCSKWILFNMMLSVITVSRLIVLHRIDFIICDTMYGGVTAARLRRLPVVFITNQNHFNGPQDSVNPVWFILNLLIRRYLRLAHGVIVPDYPPPDTVSEFNIVIPKGEEHGYHFTGPFLDINPDRYTFEQSTIFASFGGEPYKLPLYRMLREIADLHTDLFFDVFYTGAELPESSVNFASHGYVPNLYEHLARARIAIVHGGLTTLHEAMLFEKPVLIVMDPNHPEQQNNARKIVRMGVGTAVDGRSADRALLESRIAETMACCPLPIRDRYPHIDGRKNAAAIILAIAARRRR